MKRIPTLDGWRGIAILLVLIDHFSQAVRGACYPYPWLEMGEQGVNLFFVLSGYLITTTLMSEPIDLKKFYVRRFFRLMPVAWTFLAVLGLLNFTGVRWITLGDLSGCLLSYSNYRHASYCVGQFWSLAVEEQFYLVWPSLLLLFGVRRCKWIATTGAVACAAYRFAFWSHYYKWPLLGRTEVRADSLLVGCLLAIAINENRERVTAWSAKLWPFALALFGFAIYRYQTIQPLWESLATACLLAYTSLHPQSRFGRILAFQPLAVLGLLSYSIYVWQQPFTIFRGWTILPAIASMTSIALVSYCCIEQPMRRMGKSLTDVKAGEMVAAD